MRLTLLTLAAALLFSSACTKKATPETEVPVEESQDETTEAAGDAVDDAAGDAADDAAEADDGPYEPQGEVQRWHVSDALVDCMGVAPEKCMRIRRANHPEWENFHGQIERFEYEEGTRYILEVDIVEVETPPADASSLRHVLVRQVVPLAEEDAEKTCTSNEDCEEGTFCTGPAGCDIPWTCEEPRPCTMDLRAFCSCEGETIYGSSTCPPAPYKHPGECQ